MKTWGLTDVTSIEMEPGHPNIVGYLHGTQEGPNLIFNGHMDVLPEGLESNWTVPPYSGLHKDGCLYGRGSVDMKGGTFGSFLAGAIIQRLGIPLRGKVMFTAVCDEQTCGERGIRYLIDAGYIQKEHEDDMGINCEPTNLDWMVIANKGVLRADVTFIGKTAHGARPWLGVNAIEHANRFMTENLKENEVLSTRSHPLLSPPHILLAMIEGGNATNTVPDYCKVTITKRLLPGDSREESVRRYQEILDDMKEADPSVQPVLHIWTQYRPPVEIDPDLPIVDYVRRAHEKVRGCELKFRGGEGGNRRFHVVNTAHIPMPVIGPGDVTMCGAPDEHVPVRDLIDAVKMYALTILYALGI